VNIREREQFETDGKERGRSAFETCRNSDLNIGYNKKAIGGIENETNEDPSLGSTKGELYI
jgi:hypothetical protein